MCHNPILAQAIWEVRRRDLLAEAAEGRRVEERRRSTGRGWYLATGTRQRLGMALIGVGMRLQGVSAGSAAPARLAAPDPSR